MRLESVFVRFYKSFNFDYVSKLGIEGQKRNVKSWDSVQGHHYPFLEISIEPQITTIVGANESGKSHLLSAIEKGIKGFSTSGGRKQPIHRRDFCRYSNWFTSVEGGPTYPDFGFKWGQLDDDDIDRLKTLWAGSPAVKGGAVHFFRIDRNICNFYVNPNDEPFQVPFTDENQNALNKWFPRVLRLEADIALPNSVSIKRLLKERYPEPDGKLPEWEDSGRRFAAQLIDVASSVRKYLSELPRPAKEPPPTVKIEFTSATYQGLYDSKEKFIPPDTATNEDERRRMIAEFNLAYDLLFEIAKIKKEDVGLLSESILEGDPGTVQAIVDNMNEALRKKLNFPRVWAQDRNFSLRVQATDHELEFLIGDRTGRSYSFHERSSGLKHFLSYYVQYLRYNPEGHSEILLMDEPDAFLSGEGQQDLLKVFEMFVDPNNPKRKGRGPLQVIYVTHSPFLIDKNHSERVRALEKGEGNRGTRVIAGPAKNHYEPLRSAFGAFVGETTFISGCNLITEGQADQMLLASASSHLRRIDGVPEEDTLDLNRLTIVPAGGGDTVPDFVYLARGRGGTDKPAVIVLLDSDNTGNVNKERIVKAKKGSQPGKKALLPEEFVVQLGDFTRAELTGDTNVSGADDKPLKEIEDVVPPQMVSRAAKQFATQILGWSTTDLKILNEQSIRREMESNSDSAYFAVNRIFRSKLTGENNSTDAEVMGKVTFARIIADMLNELYESQQANSVAGVTTGLNEFENTMRCILRKLRRVQISAEKRRKEQDMRGRVEEKIDSFLSDYGDHDHCPREVGRRVLLDIESELVEGDESEISLIRQQIVKMMTTHSLHEDPVSPIKGYGEFLAGLERIRTAREQVDVASAKPSSVVGTRPEAIGNEVQHEVSEPIPAFTSIPVQTSVLVSPGTPPNETVKEAAKHTAASENPKIEPNEETVQDGNLTP